MKRWIKKRPHKDHIWKHNMNKSIIWYYYSLIILNRKTVGETGSLSFTWEWAAAWRPHSTDQSECETEPEIPSPTTTPRKNRNSLKQVIGGGASDTVHCWLWYLILTHNENHMQTWKGVLILLTSVSRMLTLSWQCLRMKIRKVWRRAGSEICLKKSSR